MQAKEGRITITQRLPSPAAAVAWERMWQDVWERVLERLLEAAGQPQMTEPAKEPAHQKVTQKRKRQGRRAVVAAMERTDVNSLPIGERTE